MSLGRVFSRDVAQLQLHRLHNILNISVSTGKSQSVPIRSLCASRPRISSRGYAAKATTPTKSVKTAVKRTARQPAARSSRTTTTKKTAAKKAVPKKRARPAKKKAVKKKPVPKKRVLTEKAKAQAEQKEQKDRINKLIETALNVPKSKPATAWMVYITERLQDPKNSAAGGRALGASLTELAASFKSISPAEREHYNHLAGEAKLANQAAYEAWVKQHTPLEIQRANTARRAIARLRKEYPKRKSLSHYILPIQDVRQVSRPVTAFFQFVAERHHSGDMRNIAVTEATKLSAAEWKALTASERKKYEDLAENDKARYYAEHERVYGIPAKAARAAVS